MRKPRIAAWFVTFAVAAAVFSLAAQPGAAAEEKPAAGEIGISAKEIRIAIVADVDSPLSPGVFQGQVDAIRGYAKYINKRGGVAGRKLVVDFIDSKLSPDEARNATIKACAEDFAMVGTAAVFLSNVDDMVGCVDATGTPTGLPDIPTVTQDRAQQCSPVSYSIAPSPIDCSTNDKAVKTYRISQGQVRYYAKRFPDLHGICIGQNDLRSTTITGLTICDGVEKLGVKLDADGFYGISARSPQTAFTPLVASAKDAGSNYVYALMADAQATSLRREAKLQGLSSVEVWDCSRACYSDQFLTGGADVDGQYIPLSALPLEETTSNKALAAYVKTVGKDKIDGFGETGWIAAILFHETIDKIVASNGINGITRARFLDALSKTKAFDAQGILGTTDIGSRTPSDCYDLVQVQNGTFARVHPKKPAMFDCSSKNTVIVELADP